MSISSDALEAAAQRAMGARAALEAGPGPRGRAEAERAFAALLRLCAGRIRHFIARYGLVDHREDAEQACAIAIHRAIGSYDPGQSRFTTFVNWQLRGELQSLRFRLRTDQRSPALKVQAATLSLEALTGSDGLAVEDLLADTDAEIRTEQLASDYMARRAADGLISDYVSHMRGLALRQADRITGRPRGAGAVRPGTVHPHDLARIEARLECERAVLKRHLCGSEDEDEAAGDLSRERARQITRRAVRVMSERATPGMRRSRRGAPA